MRSAPDSTFSSSVAPVEGEGEKENSRPLLSDMKVMVLQGESLLSIDGSGTVEGEEGLQLAPTSTRSTVSSRELSKAQTVVEVAEEVRLRSCDKLNVMRTLDLIASSPLFFTQWLSRVREAMAFSAELHLNKQTHRRKGLQQKFGDEMDVHDDDDDDDGEDASADALNELRELLKESDEMPVYMEEAVLLKCQLQALEWANKAALVLPSTSSIDISTASTAFETDVYQLSQCKEDKCVGTGIEAGSGAKISEGRQRARPRLAEVQRLAKEIKK